MKNAGYALKQLPERFSHGPRTETLDRYIRAKYKTYDYHNGHFQVTRFPVKAILYNPEWTPEQSSDKYRYVEYPENGLRKVGDAHDLVRLNHTGWYTDNHQEETVHGEVYQLPARDGTPCYVPAISDHDNDAACIDFYSVTEDKEEAARWADSMAENYADREREYQAKEETKQRLADIGEEIKAEYAEFRRIAKEIKANCDALKGVAVVRELVKEKWQRTKAEIRKLRTEQQRIERNGLDY